MSFIPTLWGDTEESLAFKRGDARTTYIEIGNSDDYLTSYFLNVELYPSEDGNEFTFSLIEARDGQATAIFDSSIACQIIQSPSYRKILRRLLVRMSEELVRTCNLPHFYMVTFNQHLPEKALTKYRELCNVFETCGYDVTENADVNGRHIWIMNRKSVSAL